MAIIQYNDYARRWTTEKSWFSSLQGQETLFFNRVHSPAVRLTKPPSCLRIPGPLVLAVKPSGHGVDESPPASAKVKNARSYTSIHPYGA
jgi:hypothetical protein